MSKTIKEVSFDELQLEADLRGVPVYVVLDGIVAEAIKNNPHPILN